MNRAYKTILKETLLQGLMLKSSGCLPQVSRVVGLVTNSQPVRGFCCGCGRNVLAGNTIVFREKELQRLVSPSTRWLLDGRSSSSQVAVMRRLRRVSEPRLLSNISSVLDQNFTLYRNYSITPRTFSAEVASSSATSSAQAVSTLAVNSSSSNGLLFSDFFPVYGAERAIEYIHQLTGLPWWSTIVLTAFTLRVVLMLPITIHSFKNIAKLQNLQQEVKEMAERLKTEVAMAMKQFQWDEKRAKEEYTKNFNRLLKELYIRNNCHPLKGVATFWIQLPVWLSVTYALRNLSLRAVHPDLDRHIDLKSMSEQGVAWFPDLTVTDSTFLLPIMMGTVTLINTEMNYLSVPEVTKYRKWLTYFLRGLALAFIPISATMPSSMVMYWVCSGMFGTVQNLLFDYSPFRRLIGLPKSNIESNSPLRTLRQRAVARYLKS